MKRRYHFIWAIMVVVIMQVLVLALIPPPPANQYLGIYDTSLTQYNESMCRDCHSSGVPDRHHLLVQSGKFGCIDCHPKIVGSENQSILIDRNCIDCHSGTPFYANSNISIDRPHHNTTYAQNRDCKACHGSYVDNYNDGHYVPTYPTSLMTPLTGYRMFDEASGRYLGGCFACHQNNESTMPKIYSNGEVHHKALLGLKNTTVSYCSWCHPVHGGLLNIRTCEDCHSVRSLHNIQYDYNNTDGMLGSGHIGNDWDCNGCHASANTASDNLYGSIVPDVFSITPNKLKAYETTQLDIMGTNFVQDSYSTMVRVDGVNYTPATITDSQIVVTIPPLNAGVHEINIIKGDSQSKLSALTVVQPANIQTVKFAKGTMTIDGTGFGAQPELFENLGIFVQHNKVIYRADGIISWNDNNIVAKSAKLSKGDILTINTLNGNVSTIIK
jgi:hypothetical protein